MTITEQEREAMLEAARPLIKWMAENCHPHCKAIVTQTDVELVEGKAVHRTEEFLHEDQSVADLVAAG